MYVCMCVCVCVFGNYRGSPCTLGSVHYQEYTAFVKQSHVGKMNTLMYNLSHSMPTMALILDTPTESFIVVRISVFTLNVYYITSYTYYYVKV